MKSIRGGSSSLLSVEGAAARDALDAVSTWKTLKPEPSRHLRERPACVGDE